MFGVFTLVATLAVWRSLTEVSSNTRRKLQLSYFTSIVLNACVFPWLPRLLRLVTFCAISATVPGCGNVPVQHEAGNVSVKPEESVPLQTAGSVEENWPKLRGGMSSVQVESLLGPLLRVMQGNALIGKSSELIRLEIYACADSSCSLLFCDNKLSKWALDLSLANPIAGPPGGFAACQPQGKRQRKREGVIVISKD